jgi:hypothetical protein
MLKIDRMEFPKKYPIPNWLKIVVMLLVLGSLMLYNMNQDKLKQKLVISDVQISAYNKAQIEVEYSVSNETHSQREAWLLLKVYDNSDSLLTSSLFLVNLKAGEKKEMVKVLNDLARTLQPDEKPGAVTLEPYIRKGLL